MVSYKVTIHYNDTDEISTGIFIKITNTLIKFRDENDSFISYIIPISRVKEIQLFELE